jgi:hypothetical protein
VRCILRYNGSDVSNSAILVASVPAHVEMMGLIGMGNNPMVGASVAVAVAVEEAMSK